MGTKEAGRPHIPRNRKARFYTRRLRASTITKRPRVSAVQGFMASSPPREEKDFTKLNTEITSILAIMKTDPNYRPPRPMNPNRPPSSKYCDYHEDTGHTTERCYQLRNLIENKIQSGELSHFTLREDPNQPNPAGTDRIIDVISGGFASRGSSNNAKKLYAREVCRIDSKRPKQNPSLVISFSDEDYPEGIIRTHQDAMVITTKIGTNTVKKILIDDGSSVDILYHGAFSRMELGDKILDRARNAPLYGFTGNEVRVLGTIDLPVLFGSPPAQLWHVVKFHVINATNTYNAILGRTTTTALRAITSILHLKMKFPTEFGV
ncbi:uncharacterized protein LOC108212399 [Daucus carota subsp. sativus]|uniref:uncharacterized protein LOC108212399 n=1 Tax=Daucus carota subsp. sativus TaxID=79200 RepID=UPI0007EFFC03|nr:PREDICTED: uncharacterized protein LOC108212399 [Daucus carota subsp. sativus]